MMYRCPACEKPSSKCYRCTNCGKLRGEITQETGGGRA